MDARQQRSLCKVCKEHEDEQAGTVTARKPDERVESMKKYLPLQNKATYISHPASPISVSSIPLFLPCPSPCLIIALITSKNSNQTKRHPSPA